MSKLSILGVLSTVQIGIFTFGKTLFRSGKKVGTDQFGNAYYEAPGRKGLPRTRRWVIYNGPSEASTIPPLWHGWMHYQTDVLPTSVPASNKKWVKEHVPNLTGTTKAYKPKGDASKGGKRAAATGDYEAWKP